MPAPVPASGSGDSKPALLLAAFARAHPAGFASGLVGASAAEVAQILGRLPADTVAPILRRLPQRLLAPVLARSPEEATARWIAVAAQGEAASLYRRLPPDRRRAVRPVIRDPGRRRALDRAASFPPGSVGALADWDFAWAPASVSIEEAARRLALVRGRFSGRVLVLDAEDRVVGGFDAVRALCLDRRIPVGECVTPMPRLRAGMPAAAALDAAGWEDQPWLPVVDRLERVVGVATRKRLAAARSPASRSDSSMGAAAIPLHLLQALGRTLTGWAALLKPAGGLR